MTATNLPLFGLRVFVVEDEALIAMMLENMLEDLGCDVVGVAGTLPQALAQIEAIKWHIDAALLDVNIGGEKIYPVADVFLGRGIPFLFCTGYAATGIAPRYRDLVVLDKPYSKAALARELALLSGRVLTS